MANQKQLVKFSRFLSLVLRHAPETIALQLDAQGWASIDELLKKAARKGHHITLAELQTVVATNNKKRFTLSEDGLRIRAAQGHSIQVDLEFKPTQAPDVLYHGTAERFWDAIRREGLRSMSRQHVHLSADRETALNVGGRHGKPIILVVDAKQMQSDGFVFFVSDNGVWLTDTVPTQYVSSEKTPAQA